MFALSFCSKEVATPKKVELTKEQNNLIKADSHFLSEADHNLQIDLKVGLITANPNTLSKMDYQTHLELKAEQQQWMEIVGKVSPNMLLACSGCTTCDGSYYYCMRGADVCFLEQICCQHGCAN